MYHKIDDYGLIGDMRSLALVSRYGSIDYCCLPRMDSPTVFAALLDDEKGGNFSIEPKEAYSSEQKYVADTNILQVSFKTESGTADMYDFMPVFVETELYDANTSEIYRYIKCGEGNVSFKAVFSPRPGYARAIPTIQLKSRRIEVFTGSERLALVFSKDVSLEESSKGTVAMRFSLEKGEEIWFALRYGEDLNADISTKSFAATQQFWRNWLGMYKEGLSFGSYASLVRRSLLAVKLLTFKPSGALIAAATTSLPESLGGERNWDYRFPWLRDALIRV